MTTIEEVRNRAELDAKAYGYRLNPDPDFLSNLLEGLKTNEERYGYPSCPCRMSSGVFEVDRDIICPCDYRDLDVQEYGSCYCCLYVDDTTFETGKIKPIPERRPHEKQLRSLTTTQEQDVEVFPKSPISKTARVLHFCRVCGYVVFREEPPYVCPICRAKREMFAEIILASR